MADEQQTDQNPDGNGAGDGSGAQTEDLDSILANIDADFEEGTTTQQRPQEDKSAVLEARLAQLEGERASHDVDGAVTSILDGLESSTKPSRRIVRGLLKDLADEDPRIGRAFQNRAKDPASWKRVLSGVSRTISKEFEDSIDQDVTEGRRALTAALQGKSKTTPNEDADQKRYERFVASCSDQEFEEMKRTGKIPESFK